MPLPNNEFVKKTVTALDYDAAHDPTGVIAANLSNSQKWNIKESTGSTAKDVSSSITAGTYDPQTDQLKNDREVTTLWNPNLGLITTDGGLVSPATTLFHEGGHAYDILVLCKTYTQLKALGADINNPDYKQYDKIDDAIVIPKYEVPFIKAVNAYESQQTFLKNGVQDNAEAPQQGIRTNHSGSFYNTTGVLSIQPKGGVDGGNQIKDTNGALHAVKGPGKASTATPLYNTPSKSERKNNEEA